MAEDSDFSLISVDVDDEDDMVIQAGAVASKPRASTRVEEASAAETPEVAGASTDDEDQRDAAEEMAHDHARAQRMAERDMNRMVTTEEDLHAPVPYAHMQRTILIILAVVVVLFLVYYLAVVSPTG